MKNVEKLVRRRICTQWNLAFLVVLFSLAFCATGLADEIMPIGQILNNAKSLAAHLITFKGRIESFEKVQPAPVQRCYMAPRYRAVVKDDSGSIIAILCGKHLDEQGELHIGDQVVIRAVLDVDESDGANHAITAIGVRMERALN